MAEPYVPDELHEFSSWADYYDHKREQAAERARANERRLRYWRPIIGSGKGSGRVINGLIHAGVESKDSVDWSLLRRLEKEQNNNWGRLCSDLCAAAVGLPPRAQRSLERQERVEAALREMVRHADGLIASGAWRHFSELERAKEALKA